MKPAGWQPLYVSSSALEPRTLTNNLAENPGHLPVYNWYPDRLAKANASAELLSRRLREHVTKGPLQSAASLKDWVNSTLIVLGLGITDALSSELDALVGNPDASVNTFAAMASRRAHIGWSTHGHSAVDVNIYSSGGPGTDKIRGNVENTEIGKFLHTYLDVDVNSITKELKDKMPRGELGIMRTLDHWSNLPEEAE
jgi:alkaline phosphatase